MKRNKYDHILVGIASGIIAPIIALGIVISLVEFAVDQNWLQYFHPKTQRLIALIAVIIPFQIFRRHRMDNAMRGVIFPTLAYAGLWVYLYHSELGMF